MIDASLDRWEGQEGLNSHICNCNKSLHILSIFLFFLHKIIESSIRVSVNSGMNKQLQFY